MSSGAKDILNSLPEFNTCILEKFVQTLGIKLLQLSNFYPSIYAAY